MTTIILYGSLTDTAVSLKLCRALERYGGVLHICGGKITSCSFAQPRFLLYETDCLETVELDGGILVMKSNLAEDTPRPGISQRVVCVVESDNEAALLLLKKIPCAAITCGMSARDTLTASSIGEHSACISVRQEMHLLDGTVLEPCEIRVSLTVELYGYDLFCVCAVLLLAGCMREDLLFI